MNNGFQAEKSPTAAGEVYRMAREALQDFDAGDLGANIDTAHFTCLTQFNRNAKRGPDQAEKSSLMKSQWMSRHQCQVLSAPAASCQGAAEGVRLFGAAIAFALTRPDVHVTDARLDTESASSGRLRNVVMSAQQVSFTNTTPRRLHSLRIRPLAVWASAAIRPRD